MELVNLPVHQAADLSPVRSGAGRNWGKVPGERHTLLGHGRCLNALADDRGESDHCAPSLRVFNRYIGLTSMS